MKRTQVMRSFGELRGNTFPLPKAEPKQSFVPSPVVSRKPLLEIEGLLVQVSVPSIPYARDSKYVGRPYHEAKASVRGGNVLCFFYGLPAGAMQGTKVNARITQLCERLQENGVRTICVDLEVIEDQKMRPVYDFKIHSTKGQFAPKEETLFSCEVPQADGVVEIRHYVEPEPRAAK